MTHQALVALAEALSRATGYTWLVIEPYDVGVVVRINHMPWSYRHGARLMLLDVDPEDYAQRITEEFMCEYQKAAGMQ